MIESAQEKLVPSVLSSLPDLPPRLLGLLKKAVRDNRLLSTRTVRSLKFDLLRFRARLRHQRKQIAPGSSRLHLGCGKRRVSGWLNVDVSGSEYDIDFACGILPWPTGSFDVVVAQQVIEHLDLDTELLPLLSELRRVSRPGAQIWLSTPDIESICESYRQDRGRALEADRKLRWPDFDLRDRPSQHMLNVLFHQGGEHINLFDYDFLRWMLERNGFTNCQRTNEDAFRRIYPEFPERNDDDMSVYVRAELAL
jgi:predicted SAM-dependent methyltransferase